MSYSLNETEALVRKAARGAGYSWGEAEDAGRAVRWLEARSLPGAAAALHLFGLKTTGALAPDSCGLTLGTRLSDGVLPEGTLANVDAPLLLLPFAHAMGTDQTLTWLTGTACLGTDGTATLTGAPPALRDDMTLSQGRSTGTSLIATTRADIPQAVIDGLTALAARTYAPATEASRLLGAGAGLSDND